MAGIAIVSMAAPEFGVYWKRKRRYNASAFKERSQPAIRFVIALAHQVSRSEMNTDQCGRTVVIQGGEMKGGRGRNEVWSQAPDKNGILLSWKFDQHRRTRCAD